MEIDSNTIIKYYGNIPLLKPIKDFFNAYKLYALKYDITTDVNVMEEELLESNWKKVWIDLQENWPQVAKRFNKEEYDKANVNSA